MSLGLSRFAFTKGLHDLGNGGYAWLQPDGGWGWSNAGLIVDQGQSLLVDTLFDVPLTRDMLEAMRRAEPKAATRIDLLVNTHHNGDHCFGNECCQGAEIIAHTLAREAMTHEGRSAWRPCWRLRRGWARPEPISPASSGRSTSRA